MENHQYHEGDKDDDEDEDDDNKQNYGGSEQFQDTLLPQQEVMKLKLSIMSVLEEQKWLLKGDKIVMGALNLYHIQKTLFVQHQEAFNTVQSVEEECEVNVSIKVLNKVTALTDM